MTSRLRLPTLAIVLISGCSPPSLEPATIPTPRGEVLIHRFQGQPRRTIDQILDAQKELFALSDSDELVLRGPVRPAGRMATQRVQQVHNGLTVEGAEALVVEAHNEVIWFTGRLVTDLAVLPEDAALSADEATARAVSVVQHAAPPAELPVLLIARDDDEEAPGAYRLAYRVGPVRIDVVRSVTAFVDAVSGEVFRVDRSWRDTWQDMNTTAESQYDGTVPIVAQHDSDLGLYRLASDGPEPVSTLSILDALDWFSVDEIMSTTSTFPGLAGPVSAHWAGQQTLSYFRAAHGRNGWDGANGPLRMHVDWSEGSAEAVGDMTNHVAYVFVGHSDIDDAMTIGQLDVIAHEITHTIIDATTDFVDLDEAAAIEEGFADVLAILAERHALGPGTWYIGEHISLLNGIRSVEFPKDPDVEYHGATTYLGENWTCPPLYSDCRYHRSGVLSRWFYLLAEGGSGHIDEDALNPSYNVTGIGTDPAGQIVFKTMVSLLSDPDFPILREHTAQMAIALHGEFTGAHKAVLDAWDAVAVPGAPFSPAGQTPAPDATGVPAWPVVFKWEPGAGEVKWQIDVSKTPDFGGIVFSTTAAKPPTGWPTVQAVLDRNMTYYWRVRGDGGLGWMDWRLPTTFTTSSMVPQPVSPSGSGNHPWSLPFYFSSVGAYYYDIEIHTNGDCGALVFPRKKVDLKKLVERPSGYVTVPKQAMLGWRVRAAADAARTRVSNWSHCMKFSTTEPQASVVDPTGIHGHPWPTKFVWNAVTGATYDFKVRSEPSPPVYAVSKTNLKGTSLSFNMPAHLYADDVYYTWQIGILGPPWGTTAQPEPLSTRETGLPSPPETYKAYGNETVPDVVYPKNSSLDPVCHPYDSSSALWIAWTPVDKAEGYEITIHEAYCPLTDPPTPCHSTDVLVYQDSVPLNELVPSGFEVGYPIPSNVATLYGPTTNNDHVAYWVEVGSTATGYSGELLRSPVADNGLYWIDTSYPVSTAPADGASVPADSAVTLWWDSEFAHGGGFVVTVWDDDNCDGGVVYSEVEMGVSHGTNTHNVPASALEPGSSYSWSVHPFQYDVCPGPTKDSQCRRFTTESQPPEVPQTMDYFFGTIGVMLAVFSASDGADTYDLEICQGAPCPGGTLVYGPATWGVNALIQERNDTFVDATGSLPPPGTTWFFVRIFGTQASNAYFYRVRACTGNLCSAWSESGQWDETLPWLDFWAAVFSS